MVAAELTEEQHLDLPLHLLPIAFQLFLNLGIACD